METRHMHGGLIQGFSVSHNYLRLPSLICVLGLRIESSRGLGFRFLGVGFLLSWMVLHHSIAVLCAILARSFVVS